MSQLSDVVASAYNAVFHPKRLVTVSGERYGGSVRQRLGQAWQLFTVYLANLALYAGPLTLAGFGLGGVPRTPAWFGRLVLFGDPSTAWTFVFGFLQNSLFILVATALTFVTFHVGVLVTLRSQGFLRTAYTVTYSTSVYLAGIFTVVWYASMASGIRVARDLLLGLQKRFIYAIIDTLGANVGLPSGRPVAVPLSELSTQGSLLLALLAVLVVYYFYSLYLGTRINHETDRLSAVIVVLAVVISPVIYVASSVLAVTATIP